MPLYDYKCECGNRFERILPVSECDSPQCCDWCYAVAEKIIVNGHGGIRGDECSWVKDVGTTLEDPSIQTISDLRRFLDRNPNIKPKESHPALPSSVGDIKKRDEAQIKRERRTAAHELIRKNRAISVNT